ncbi:MAG: hypothetical protein NUV80_03080 [Candidatus Berkelbacteria bacterium]|nr:hypothetical protein [Candidatus Berkelbacteria bacterium]MCR4307517.1 hypothetical protein [Candidatus Berkelbacteria bacterium]
MTELSELTKRVEVIEARNSKVELDKQWETSTFRKVFLLTITYVLLAIYITLIGVNRPWLNAIIPSLGFLISTLTLGWVKAVWINRRRS